MWITANEFWTIIHGLSLGGLLLMIISAILICLLYMNPGWLTENGKQKNIKILNYGVWLIAVLTWLTVIIGTYIVYPWYRAKPPAGADLISFPRSFLMANPKLSGLHTFGMEWKEHIAWLTPILVTAVAFIVIHYGNKLLDNPKILKALITIISISVFAIIIAVVLGALINKAAPVR
jgi:hypothetical protein